MMKRKIFSAALAAWLLIFSLCGCGCGASEKNSGGGSAPGSVLGGSPSETPGSGNPGDPSAAPGGGEPAIPDGYKAVVCTEQDFSTRCPEDYTTRFVKGDGLYIQIEPDSTAIPYVLIFRAGEFSIDLNQFIEEVHMVPAQEQYGDDLAACSRFSDYDFAGGKYEVLELKYRLRQGSAEYLITSFRVFAVVNGEYVVFNAKYIGNDSEDTLAALETAVRYFRFGAAGGNAQGTTGGTGGGTQTALPGLADASIRLTEAANVKLVPYADVNGYFTMEIPEGWKVSIGFPNGLPYDAISYPITVYDPAHDGRKFYFCLVESAFTSETMSFYDPTIMVSKDHTVAGFFRNLGIYNQDTVWGYTDFTALDDLGPYYNGNAVLATCRSSADAALLEGVFAHGGAQRLDAMMSVNYYDITMITAAAEDAVDWIPVMTRSLGTLQFTEKFDRDRATLWQSMFATANYTSAIADETREMLSSSWEARNRSHDIQFQKQCDAILGYERVYNEDTGEVYKVPLDFYDQYSGELYRPITDDMYGDAVTGYIEY